MRCALECEVEGNLRLPSDVSVSWYGDRKLSFTRDAGGLVRRVRIEGVVEEADAACQTVRNIPGQPVSFESTGGVKISSQLREELQAIESTLGLFCNVARLRWEFATIVLIPENAEEAQNVQWNNVSVSRAKREYRALSLEEFGTLLHTGYHARELSHIMSFYREGNMDMDTSRFISAFFSFHFVLEGLYANGQFKTQSVWHEFKRSTVLRSAVQEAIELPLYSKPAKFPHILTIDQLLSHYKQEKTTEGLLYMLVRMRGDLHHFSVHPSKMSNSPFVHQDYELLANFIHDICLKAVYDEVLSRFPR